MNVSDRRAELKRISSGKLPKVRGWNGKGLPSLAESVNKDEPAGLVLRTPRGEELPTQSFFFSKSKTALVIARVGWESGEALGAHDARQAAVLGFKIVNGGGRYQVAVWPDVSTQQEVISRAPVWVSPPMSERALSLFVVDRGVAAAAVGGQALPAVVALEAAVVAADGSGGTRGKVKVACAPLSHFSVFVDGDNSECLPGTAIPDTPLTGTLRCALDEVCVCSGERMGWIGDRGHCDKLGEMPECGEPNPSDQKEVRSRTVGEHPGVLCDGKPETAIIHSQICEADADAVREGGERSCALSCFKGDLDGKDKNGKPIVQEVDCITNPQPSRLKAEPK